MAISTPDIVQRQVARVRRRLFMQTLVETCYWSWTAGLVVLGIWFLLQPLLWHEPGAAAHWIVAGVLLGLATVSGFVGALWRMPSPLAAALALDERFALRERVTTWLLLKPEAASSAAGRALQADVRQRLGSLRVQDKFPIQFRSRVLLAPALGTGFAVLLLFLGPVVRALVPVGTDTDQAVQVRELQETLDNLKKVIHKPRVDQPLAKEQKELDEALAKLLDKPLPENQEQIRERVQEVRRLEEKIQERVHSLQEQAHRGDRLKQQLAKLGAAADAKKRPGAKEGDLNELEEALAKGKLDQALEALDKLSKKLKDKGASDRELALLAQQLHELQEKLQRLVDLRAFEEQLKRALDEGKLTPEQMKELLARELDELQDLKELADLLKELDERMLKDAAGAMKALQKLRGKLEKMKLADEELDELELDAEALAEARAAMLLALQRLNMPGPLPGKEASNLPGFGKRPFGKEPNGKTRAERQRTKIDPAGEQHVTWSGSADFKKVPAAEVGGVVRQSAQNAYQALDRQRIPPDAAEITRRYFEKLAESK